MMDKEAIAKDYTIPRTTGELQPYSLYCIHFMNYTIPITTGELQLDVTVPTDTIHYTIPRTTGEPRQPNYTLIKKTQRTKRTSFKHT